LRKSEIFVKNRDFSYLFAFDAPVRGIPVRIFTPIGTEILEWWGYPTVKKLYVTV